MKISTKVKNKVISIIARVVKLFYEHIMRKRLRNNDFSIICSNCIGGIIYNRLGKEFLSPTINLWMYQTDFLKFALNLKSYLEKELVFVKTDHGFPVAHLGDITIFFNHYKNVQEARECWNRRKKRVNYDNLFLIMYDRDGISEEDICVFQKIKCKNKIMFTSSDCTNKDYLKKMISSGRNMSEQYMDTDKWGLRTFEKQFDYVKWLNGNM